MRMHTNHVGTTVLGGPNGRRTVGDDGPYNAYINRVGEDLCVLPRNIPIISQRLRVDSEVDPYGAGMDGIAVCMASYTSSVSHSLDSFSSRRSRFSTNHVGTTVLGGPNVRRTVGDDGPYNAYTNRVGEDLCVLPFCVV